MDVGAALRALAERQHGVVASHQARPLGSRHAIEHELGSARWEQIHPSIHRVAGSDRSVEQVAMARLLRAGPGAAMSHHTSLAVWGVDGFDLLPLHVIRMRGSNGVKVAGDGVRVHEARRLPPHHLTVVGSFVVTTPARTAADLAAGMHPARLERIVDGLWVRGLVTHDSLARVVEDLTSRGRRGIRVLRTIVEARGRDHVPPASSLEARLDRVLTDAGIPGVRRQVDVGGEQWAGRTDFRIADTPVLVEAQSERYHAALSAIADDERRRRAIEHAGFVVVEAWDAEIWYRPERVVARVRAALRRSASVAPGHDRV